MIIKPVDTFCIKCENSRTHGKDPYLFVFYLSRMFLHPTADGRNNINVYVYVLIS